MFNLHLILTLNYNIAILRVLGSPEDISSDIADGLAAVAESIVDGKGGWIPNEHPATKGALRAFKAGWLGASRHNQDGVWFTLPKGKAELVWG